MKRCKQRRIIQKRIFFRCDFCEKILSSLKDYQKYVYGNSECRRNLPYSCEFCSYIGYKQNGFQKHLQCKPTCEQFYKEKLVTTGQILDFYQVKLTRMHPYPTKHHINIRG